MRVEVPDGCVVGDMRIEQHGECGWSLALTCQPCQGRCLTDVSGLRREMRVDDGVFEWWIVLLLRLVLLRGVATAAW